METVRSGGRYLLRRIHPDIMQASETSYCAENSRAFQLFSEILKNWTEIMDRGEAVQFANDHQQLMEFYIKSGTSSKILKINHEMTFTARPVQNGVRWEESALCWIHLFLKISFPVDTRLTRGLLQIVANSQTEEHRSFKSSLLETESFNLEACLQFLRATPNLRLPLNLRASEASQILNFIWSHREVLTAACARNSITLLGDPHQGISVLHF